MFRVVGREGCILALYALLGVAATWPLALHLDDGLVGLPGDVFVFPWGIWWAREAALTLRVDPFWTNYLFYPLGGDLVFHGWLPLVSLATVPLQTLFSVVALSNLSVIGSYVFAGYAAYRLALSITGDARAACVAGTIFAGSFLRSTQLAGHYNQLWSGFIPLVLLALVRLRRRPAVASTAVLAIVGALAVYTDLYVAIFSAVTAVMYVASVLVAEWSARRRVAWPFLSGVGRAAIAAVLLTVPLLLHAFREVGVQDVRPSADLLEQFSSDLLSFVTPGPSSRIYAWAAGIL